MLSMQQVFEVNDDIVIAATGQENDDGYNPKNFGFECLSFGRTVVSSFLVERHLSLQSIFLLISVDHRNHHCESRHSRYEH
jgi:hypothetical protein